MKKIINTIAVTGADDSTSIQDMVKLQQKYPFIEFAILIKSPTVSRSSFSRFPCIEWLNKLAEQSHLLNLSMHLCSRPVKDILDHGVLPDHIANIKYKRIQINTHAEPHSYSRMSLYKCFEENANTTFIFQLDGVNEHMFTDSIDAGYKNIAGLYDLSHGAGILPDKWIETPKNGILYGYAGGLSPENVASQLSKIEKLTDNTWIDAETYLRTDSKFDLNKVVAFVEASKPWNIL
jgi:hypothetical protein